MTEELFVVWASRLDVEALALVIGERAPVALLPTTPSALLDSTGPGLRVLAFHPSGETLSLPTVLAIRNSGHSVLVVGDFDTTELEALRAHSVPHVLRKHLGHIAAFGQGHIPEPQPTRPNARLLSPRETEVARLLVRKPSLTRVQMADELGLSPATVKLYVGKIRAKVGAVGQSHGALLRRIKTSGIVS